MGWIAHRRKLTTTNNNSMKRILLAIFTLTLAVASPVPVQTPGGVVFKTLVSFTAGFPMVGEPAEVTKAF
jgi:hypothetical protein